MDAAAWSVVAEIISSKRMAGISADSAPLPRNQGCCGCRGPHRATGSPFMFRFLSPVLMWFQTLCHSPLNLPF